MTLELKFNLILGETISSIPAPVIKEKVTSPPAPKPTSAENPPILKIPQSIVLTKRGHTWTGIYTHPTWGESAAIDISVSCNHIAFSALSGNDDKGGHPVYFNFAFARVDSSDSVVGFAGGRAPYFRSFLPVEGVLIEH